MGWWRKRQSSVARRIHLSFVLAAAVPLLVLSLTAYQMVSDRLKQEAMQDARGLAKEMGMALFDRLKYVTDELKILARDIERLQTVDLAELDLGERVHGLFLSDVTDVTTLGVVLEPDESDAIRAAVDMAQDGKPLLLTTTKKAHRHLFLLVPVRDSKRRRFIGAELDATHLWDTTTIAARPERVCVLDDRDLPVYCNHLDHAAWLAASRQLVQSRGQPRSLPHDMGEPVMTAAWSLFLKPHYQFERWTMLVGVPESMALASIARFDRIFAGVAVIALLTAFLLGRRLIRSNLDPLQTLIRATRQLGSGDFNHRVELHSGDEFQQLGDSFDGMASQIGSQFHELETLARLDRALQAARSIDEVLDAAIAGLDRLIGVGRCAVRCHEHWNEPGTVWQRDFDGGDAAEGERRLPVLRTADVSADILLRSPTPEAEAAAARVGDVLGIALGNLILERRLFHQANHDWLTGLPNRSRLQDLFNAWTAEGSRSDRGVGMLLVDLDRFKQINESMGHHMGDRLLAAVAGRLREALPDDCVISRIAGDQFLVMRADSDLQDLLTSLADFGACLQRELDRPFSLGMREIRLVATMGAAVYPRDGGDFEGMLKSIDAAGFVAKSTRRGGLLVFSDGMRDALAGRLEIEQALKGAVANRELVLHYQPVVDAHSRRVRSAEALLRWERPGVGLVMPNRFIEVAEQSGLINEMGNWAIREVCRRLQAWRQAGLDIETVNVNVSSVQLGSDEFVQGVARALEDSGLPAHLLTLEVTETSLIGQFERAVDRLRSLREMGVQILVDDFGTGYASLKYLKMLPVDGIKIDRLFVKDLPDSVPDQAIVTAVVSLARASGFKLVAEGIETDAQAEFLCQCGVPLFQGFRFGKGVPADALQARLYQERDQPAFGALGA